MRLGVIFCQLFARFRLIPCEFYHTKNRISTSNSRGLKSFSGTTIYAINPYARILSVDIGQLANPAEYLKVTQIAVGAEIGFLPVANASDANNLFNVDETKFKNFVASTILGNSDSGQAILEVFGRYGYKTMTEIQDYLWGNVLQLRANNRPALNVPREIMPQPLNGDPTPLASSILSGMLNYKGHILAILG